MREGITVEVSAADRARLEVVVADRNSRQKHVWRANIILATAEGCGTVEITRRTGKSKPCVWRWQERFMREGVPGPPARQDQEARQGAAGGRNGQAGGRADPRGATRPDDPLDRPGNGQGHRDLA